jgi:hypothetical protein
LTPDEAKEIVESINAMWSKEAYGPSAADLVMVAIMNRGISFERMMAGLAKIVASSTFRPTIDQICDAAPPLILSVPVHDGDLDKPIPVYEIVNEQRILIGHRNPDTMQFMPTTRTLALNAGNVTPISEY